MINSDTSLWTPILYTNSIPDTFRDQQTGLVAGDLVGDINHPCFYTKFDGAGTPSLTDGTLGFRIRLDAAKNYSQLDFDYNLFVGIDANADGALDLFVGVDDSPNKAGKLGIWNPGPGANTGPSTTTIVSPPLLTFTEALGVNYDFSPVTKTLDPTLLTTDVDAGGKTDMFLSFSFDFQTIVSVLSQKGISITEKSPHLSYVMATATQDNALNIDINGITGGTKSTLTFKQLGAFSVPITPSGVMPEPAAVSLLATGGLVLLVGRRLIPSRRKI